MEKKIRIIYCVKICLFEFDVIFFFSFYKFLLLYSFLIYGFNNNSVNYLKRGFCDKRMKIIINFLIGI